MYLFTHSSFPYNSRRVFCMLIAFQLQHNNYLLHFEVISQKKIEVGEKDHIRRTQFPWLVVVVIISGGIEGWRVLCCDQHKLWSAFVASD